MKLYRFVSSGQIGLTPDQRGTNLPPVAPGGWQPQGSVEIRGAEIPRLGASSAQILAAIQQEGYFVYPDSVLP